MDAFKIKVEKSSAILMNKRLEKMTVLFRLMEVCIFVFIISRISTQLPLEFRVFGDCFQDLLIIITTPGFLFVHGNAIVLVLFLKSDQVSPQQTNHATEFCYEYVQSSGKEKEAPLDVCSFEDKNMHKSNSEDLRRYQNQNSCRKLRPTVTENGRKVENYSERCEDGLVHQSCDHRVSPQNLNPKCYAHDEMSSEEFRHRVEDFITRQQRSMRE